MSAEAAFSAGNEGSQLEREILDGWARLEPYVDVASGRAEPSAVGLDSADAEVVAQWGELFREEIEIVRRARNVVVHLPRTLPEDDLRQAKEFGTRLLDLLLNRLAATRDQAENRGEIHRGDLS